MNHLEGIISEWLENTGYIVARNHKDGRLAKGAWAGELDIIAYNPATNHLVHNEPESMFTFIGIRSMDMNSLRRQVNWKVIVKKLL